MLLARFLSCFFKEIGPLHLLGAGGRLLRADGTQSQQPHHEVPEPGPSFELYGQRPQDQHRGTQAAEDVLLEKGPQDPSQTETDSILLFGSHPGHFQTGQHHPFGLPGHGASTGFQLHPGNQRLGGTGLPQEQTSETHPGDPGCTQPVPFHPAGAGHQHGPAASHTHQPSNFHGEQEEKHVERTAGPHPQRKHLWLCRSTFQAAEGSSHGHPGRPHPRQPLYGQGGGGSSVVMDGHPATCVAQVHRRHLGDPRK